MAKEYIEKARFDYTLFLLGYTERDLPRRALAQQAEADVAPVVHGRWVKKAHQNMLDGEYYCSACKCDMDIATGEENTIDRGLYYCFNCGAKMDGGAE